MKPAPHQVNIKANVNRPKKKKKRVMTDESILNVAMDSSANDLVKVSQLLTSGTKEIQDVLKHECVLIYECKVCRGLFRSIGNFVIHKRKYCVNKFSAVNHQDLSSKLQQVEALFKTTPSSHGVENGKTKPMRTTQPPTLSSFYQSLISKTLSLSPDSKGVSSDILKMQSATVLLDKLETSQLSRNVPDSGDLDNLLNDSSTAILREDGTIATNIQSLEDLYEKRLPSCAVVPRLQSNDEKNSSVQDSNQIRCSKCKYTAQTRTALHKHLQDVHFTLYKCTQCDKYMHSVRSVLRHLNEVHHVKKESIVQKFKKKVIASKVVKSVPKHLYRKTNTQAKAQLIDTVPPICKSNNLLCCDKCSTVFTSTSGSTQCTTCAISSDSSSRHPQLPSPAKYLMKVPLQGCVRSPASSCAGDIPSPGSPVVFPRHSIEENRNKAGIQVRMNYDKCSPGNPIVSKIETPVDEEDNETQAMQVQTASLSPASDSVSLKENDHMNINSMSNGEKENQISSKDKRKNLDSITQKLLNSKIADKACPNLKLSFSPLCNNTLLNGGNDKIRSRKSIRKTNLDFVNDTSMKPMVVHDAGIKSDILKKNELSNHKVDELITKEEPRRKTRQNSVDSKPEILATRRRSQSINKNDTSQSNCKQQDTSTGSSKSNLKVVDGNEECDELIKPDLESSGVTEPQSNAIEHSTERNLKKKRKSRVEAIPNKKRKVDEAIMNNGTLTSCDEKMAGNVFLGTNDTNCDIKAVPKNLRNSCESLEDTSSSSNNDNELLFKSLMKDIMDLTTDTCRICNITLPNKKLLRIHAASRHVGFFRFRCGVVSCGKMYFSHSDATQHARTSHNQEGDVIRVDASTLAISAALEAQARLKIKQTES